MWQDCLYSRRVEREYCKNNRHYPPYEIIWIDNSKNKYSIFEAYNLGVERAKYPYLCFMHEDIIFHTEKWGNIVANEFEDSTVGMLGVIGTTFLSPYSLSWYTSKEASRGKVIQGRTDEKGRYTTSLRLNSESYPQPVISVDGLWMVIRRNLFSDGLVKWDSLLYKGFHVYDIDMSLQVLSQHFTIHLADIMIEHKSCGNINKGFYDNAQLFHQKWDHYLPLTVDLKELQHLSILEAQAKNKALQSLKMQNQVYNTMMHKLSYRIATKIDLIIEKLF